MLEKHEQELTVTLSPPPCGSSQREKWMWTFVCENEQQLLEGGQGSLLDPGPGGEARAHSWHCCLAWLLCVCVCVLSFNTGQRAASQQDKNPRHCALIWQQVSTASFPSSASTAPKASTVLSDCVLNYRNSVVSFVWGKHSVFDSLSLCVRVWYKCCQRSPICSKLKTKH